MTKTIIAGSRDFTDYKMLRECLDKHPIEITEVVSGGARGADKMGEFYAKERSIPVKVFPADWDLHGRMAGYLRNQEMARYASCLIAFWDGKSRGTQHMIQIARRERLRVYVIRTDLAKIPIHACTDVPGLTEESENATP